MRSLGTGGIIICSGVIVCQLEEQAGDIVVFDVAVSDTITRPGMLVVCRLYAGYPKAGT